MSQEPRADDWNTALRRLSVRWSDYIPATWLYVCGWIVILAACALRAKIGAGGNRLATQDLFCFLDGAWRMSHGQVPYKDFIIDFGAFEYVLTILGLRLAHGHAEGLGYGQAIFGLILAAWSWVLTRRRMPPLLRILFTVSIVLLSISPVILGDKPDATAPSGFYNRNASALLALVMVEALCRREPETNRSRLFGGLSTGLAVALALFVKVSYFLGGGFLVFALIPCLPQSRQRWAGMTAGAAAMVLPSWLQMGGTFTPMLKVLAQLAAAKHVVLGWFALDALFFHLLPVIAFALVSAALCWRDDSSDPAVPARNEGRNMLVALFAVSITGMFLQATNDPRVALPLNPILAILLLRGLSVRRVKPSSHVSREAFLVLLLVTWGLGSVVAPAARDGASLFYAMENKRELAPVREAFFHSEALRDVSAAELPYVAKVNDGLDLLTGHLKPGDSVCTLDFSNPFPYSLGLPPFPGGISAGMRFNFDFNDVSRPDPEFLMGGASVVMMPRDFTDHSLTDSIPRIYGPYLNSHFHMEAQSAKWRLYRRERDVRVAPDRPDH
jgi:hypothetical protein